jgi:hypothetical protein
MLRIWWVLAMTCSVLGCSERRDASLGLCSSNPEQGSLSAEEQRALQHTIEMTDERCKQSQVDCARRLVLSKNGDIIVFTDLNEWDAEAKTCKGSLGSLAVLAYDSNGNYLREIPSW